jgi:hypothetical protein
MKLQLMIVINFEETFEPASIENDLSRMTFNSPQTNGTNELILVKIDAHPDPHLPKVFNLGFGPPDGNGNFRDNLRLKHVENKKVYSTVLFHGLTFLQVNPDLTLGIDGSEISLQNQNQNHLIMKEVDMTFINITCSILRQVNIVLA